MARAVSQRTTPQSRAPSVPEGGGAPLSRDVRPRMEPAMGHDLSSVRVHTSGESAEAARGFGARAFTVGSDVHFNAGEFTPGTKEGDKLLAHELTHVVQGQQSGVQRKANGDEHAAEEHAEGAGGEGEHKVSDPAEPAEKEADTVGEHVSESLHGGGKQKAAAGGGEAAGGAHKAPQIAAKLEGVGRKIFRAKKPPATPPSMPTTTPKPGAGGAGQQPAGATKPPTPPIDLDGTMKDSKKKLHVEPEKKEVKLDGGDAVQQVAGAKAALPPPQDPRTPKAGPKLDAITAQLTQLRALMASADPKTADLAKLGQAVMAAMHEYGAEFDIKTFGEPLPKFPAPRACLYNGGGDDPDKDKVPDKSTRGCHHIPPVQLSKSIAKEIDGVVDTKFTALEGKNRVIQPAGEILKRAATNIRDLGHGKGLSAIFLHSTTHKNSEGTAVHQSGIADELKRRMEARAEIAENERVPIKSTVGEKLLVNPRGQQFEPFLAECKKRAEAKIQAAEKAKAQEAIKTAEEKEKEVVKKAGDGAQLDAKQVLKEQMRIAFDNTLAQTSTAVATSLSVSFVDGDRATHAGAIADLRQKAQTSWKTILSAAD